MRRRALTTARTPAAGTIAVAQPAPVAAGAAPPPAKRPATKPKVSKPAASKPKRQDGGDAVTVVTRTVRDIAHVIPGWAKALIVALAALLLVAALLIAGAALRNRRLRALSRRLLDEVGTLSAALLPAIPPRVGLLAVTAAYRPAEGLAAGGDFYDVFPLDRQRVGIIVGDVSGHGRAALGPATFIRHMVRSYLEAGLAPRAALQLAGNVVEGHDREDFATVIAAVHDPSAGTLSYAAAGHPPPIISGTGAHPPLTVASAPPLGASNPTGLRQTTVPVAPGSTICFFTDGLFEARKDGHLLGLPRVERIVRDLPDDATAEQLVARIGREVDALRDDVAACLVRVEGGANTASTLRVEEIEVGADELAGDRLRRFLEACGLAPGEIDEVIRDATPRVAARGSVVLRVRLADDRSGVDILPATEGAVRRPELALLQQTS